MELIEQQKLGEFNKKARPGLLGIGTGAVMVGTGLAGGSAAPGLDETVKGTMLTMGIAIAVLAVIAIVGLLVDPKRQEHSLNKIQEKIRGVETELRAANIDPDAIDAELSDKQTPQLGGD